MKNFPCASEGHTYIRPSFGFCPYRLARSGHMVFIHATGVQIPVGTPNQPALQGGFFVFCLREDDKLGGV